tara:strand:- start:554 stop:697 length:144 start_codon:yes stop_codon:yes gene_type:complete
MCLYASGIDSVLSFSDSRKAFSFCGSRIEISTNHFIAEKKAPSCSKP